MKDATGDKWIKVQYPDLVSQLKEVTVVQIPGSSWEVAMAVEPRLILLRSTL